MAHSKHHGQCDCSCELAEGHENCCPFPHALHRLRLFPLRPKQICEHGEGKDGREDAADDDLQLTGSCYVANIETGVLNLVRDLVALLFPVRKCFANESRAHAEADHDNLVDDELGAAKVVFVILPHVGDLELRPSYVGPASVCDQRSHLC